MEGKLGGKRGKPRHEYHTFDTRDAALEFLSRRLMAADPNKIAVSLSERSLTVTTEDDHKTRYTLMRDGLHVTIEILP